MRSSLVIIGFFLVGVCLSRFGVMPALLLGGGASMYTLYVLIFFVGMSIGSDQKVLSTIARCDYRILLVPAATIVGTLLGVAVVSVFVTGRSLWDCLAVGSGFGYYSLSSVFITQSKGAELGTVALAANIIREVITLVFAPLLVKYFGRLAPITAGGATTMDTTLPIITQTSGKEYVVVAIVHGFIVDLSVPFLVTLFCNL